MSVLQLFSNNAVSILASPLSTTQFSFSVIAGHGELYPSPSQPGEYFLITLETVDAPLHREIVKVVARTGDTLIIASDGRGHEGTTVRNWLPDETLVDHRITADTLKRAFLNPPQLPASQPLEIKANGTTITADADSINFIGGTVTSFNNEVTVEISNGSGGGSGNINGASPVGPILVEPTWDLSVNEVTYSQFNRAFKYIVTLVEPITGETQTFEVLANVRGIIGSGTETVQWSKTNKLGYPFTGNLKLVLSPADRKLRLMWENTEPVEIQTMVTRIQHAP